MRVVRAALMRQACVSHVDDVVRNVESQEMINETEEKMEEKVHFSIFSFSLLRIS